MNAIKNRLKRMVSELASEVAVELLEAGWVQVEKFVERFEGSGNPEPEPSIPVASDEAQKHPSRLPSGLSRQFCNNCGRVQVFYWREPGRVIYYCRCCELLTHVSYEQASAREGIAL